MDALVRGLRWPIIALILVGVTHLVSEMARPEMKDFVTPAVEMPLLLFAGAWAGAGTVRAGGTFIHGIVAGVLVGLLPAALQLIGFGIVLGRDSGLVTTAALFGFDAVLWGSFLGAGYAAADAPGRAA